MCAFWGVVGVVLGDEYPGQDRREYTHLADKPESQQKIVGIS